MLLTGCSRETILFWPTFQCMASTSKLDILIKGFSAYIVIEWLLFACDILPDLVEDRKKKHCGHKPRRLLHTTHIINLHAIGSSLLGASIILHRRSPGFCLLVSCIVQVQNFQGSQSQYCIVRLQLRVLLTS